MDYKISECFAALTGFRTFVEELLATQRQQLEAEIVALKEELSASGSEVSRSRTSRPKWRL
jgi:hypothetical protein